MMMAAEAADVVAASARVGGGQGHEDKGTIIVACHALFRATTALLLMRNVLCLIL